MTSTDPDLNTRLSAERTYLAADRTFIAWLRTSLSLISFGIAIGKGGDVLENHGLVVSGGVAVQHLGVVFIGLGVLSLLGALLQDYVLTHRLEQAGFPAREAMPLGLMMGILVLCIGAVGTYFIYT